MRWTKAVFCLAVPLSQAWGLASSPPSPASAPPRVPIEVYVDFSNKPLVGDTLIIPENAGQLKFQISPSPGDMRYRLEGVDLDWKHRGGEMQFGLRFFNRQGDQVGQAFFVARGRSPGWKGTLENSTLSPRQERVIVPPGATGVSAVISSAGPPSSVGTFAVADVVVARTGSGNQPEQTLISSAPFLSRNGEGQDSKAWTKGGTRPSMATIATLKGVGGSFRAFVIFDQDIRSHADWTSSENASPEVIPGEVLLVRWKEAFTNGFGDRFTVIYNGLRSGTYRFRVQEVDMQGAPLLREYSTRLVVPLPYWKNPWFWGLVAAGLLASGISLNRYLVRINIRRHRLIEEERMRIGRDLHDDLGTRLSQICLASSHAQKSAEGQSLESFHMINGMAQEVMTLLAETVWMLNPKNDNLESLIDMLCRLVPALCKPSGVRCHVDVDPINENLTVSNDFRHHVTLTVREAVTNALRHSGSREIKFWIRFESGILKIALADDGKGISSGPAPAESWGNGLDNMRQRMKSLRGCFGIEPAEGGGTRVVLEVPIKP